SQCQYRAPFGANVLDLPADLVHMLCSAADLTLTDRPKAMRRLSDIRAGLVDRADRARLDRFVTVLEDGIGFQLFDAVERCKRDLSEKGESRVELDYPGAELSVPVSRAELDAASKRPIERIVAALEKTLNDAEVRPEAIEIACLTGGTSRMPSVVR